MALTYAHSEGRRALRLARHRRGDDDGRVGHRGRRRVRPEETRAVAIHEAGHAAASHVYMKDVALDAPVDPHARRLARATTRRSRRRSASPRGAPRSSASWSGRSGAMAAEHVFYGENSTGVGGDVHERHRAGGLMVGSCGMAPERDRPRGRFADREDEDAEREKIMERFERIGLADHEPLRRRRARCSADPLAAVLGDPRQAQGRRPAARPGLRDRLRLIAPNQRQGRADRRRAHRAPRDARRRGRRAARLASASSSPTSTCSTTRHGRSCERIALRSTASASSVGALLGVAARRARARWPSCSPGGPGAPEVAWSGWKPSDSGRRRRPADRRPRRADLPPRQRPPARARQGRPAEGRRPARADRRPEGRTGSQRGGSISLVRRQERRSTTLCGLGRRCAINSGKPSTERFLMLRARRSSSRSTPSATSRGRQRRRAAAARARQEARERAVLPSRTTSRPALDRPLEATLPEPPPPSIAALAGPARGPRRGPADGRRHLHLRLPAGPGPERLRRPLAASRPRRRSTRPGRSPTSRQVVPGATGAIGATSGASGAAKKPRRIARGHRLRPARPRHELGRGRRRAAPRGDPARVQSAARPGRVRAARSRGTRAPAAAGSAGSARARSSSAGTARRPSRACCGTTLVDAESQRPAARRWAMTPSLYFLKYADVPAPARLPAPLPRGRRSGRCVLARARDGRHRRDPLPDRPGDRRHPPRRRARRSSCYALRDRGRRRCCGSAFTRRAPARRRARLARRRVRPAQPALRATCSRSSSASSTASRPAS